MTLHQRAEQLAEAWLNGNRTHVVDTLASYPGTRAAAVAVLVYVMLKDEDSTCNAALHFAQHLQEEAP